MDVPWTVFETTASDVKKSAPRTPKVEAEEETAAAPVVEVASPVEAPPTAPAAPAKVHVRPSMPTSKRALRLVVAKAVADAIPDVFGDPVPTAVVPVVAETPAEHAALPTRY